MTTPAFSRTFAFDASTGLEKRAPAQAALTSDAYVGTQFDQGSASATDMVLVLNVESIDIAGSDEVYRFRVIGSNVANRSDGTVLATLELGKGSVIGAWETVDTVVGAQYHLYFRTEKIRTMYRYVDLHLDVTGATCSIGFSAFMSKLI